MFEMENKYGSYKDLVIGLKSKKMNVGKGKYSGKVRRV